MVFSKVAHTCVPVGCSTCLVLSSPSGTDPLFWVVLFPADGSELTLCISSYYNKAKVSVYISMKNVTTTLLAPDFRARLKEKLLCVDLISHGIRRTRNAAQLGIDSSL